LQLSLAERKKGRSEEEEEEEREGRNRKVLLGSGRLAKITNLTVLIVGPG
jgi:hypothetical protein